MSGLRVVSDEPYPDRPSLIVSKDSDGDVVVDVGTLDLDTARAWISTAFVALCMPRRITDQR